MRYLPVIGIAIVIVAAVLFFVLRTHHPAEQAVQQPDNKPTVFIPSNRSLSMGVGLTRQFFTPNNVTLRVGDTLSLSIIAIDDAHGIFSTSAQENIMLAKGEAKKIVLRAERAGELLVLCNQGCDTGVQFTATVQ